MPDEQQPSDEQSPFSGFEQEPIRERNAPAARGFRLRPQHGLLAAALIAVVAVAGVGAGSQLGGSGGDATPPQNAAPVFPDRDEIRRKCQLFLDAAGTDRAFRSPRRCVAFGERLERRVYRRCRLRGGFDCESRAERALTTYFDCRLSNRSHARCRSVADRGRA